MSEHDTVQEKCVHHWIIEAPDGRTSFGKCRFCGEIKEFFNDLTDPFLTNEASSAGDKVLDGHDKQKTLSYPFT